jgi:hypothetical protein
MSADRSRAALAVLFLAGLGCGGGGGGGGGSVPSPSHLAITPATGYSGHATPVTITGDNFLARPTGSGLDTRHQAWLGSTPLDAVTWTDPHTLQASVPAGLPAGALTLRVRNAYGREGTLEKAFTVQTAAGGALAVTQVAVAPAEANVGQAVTVTATVESVGSAAVNRVVPALPSSLSSTGGAAASVTGGPTPAAADALPPGQSATFTWTVLATAAGTVDDQGAPIPLELPVVASGEDAFSGLLVQADPRAGTLVVDQPAGLTATIVAGRATADVAQDVPVTFTISNGGTAAANLDAPTPSAALALTGGGAGSATCAAVSPAGATTVGPRASRSFTWTCRAGAAGVLTLSAGVTGTDANTGAALSATPAVPATTTVQTAASLTATVSLQGAPAAVNVGQSLTVNLTVDNGGTAAAHVTAVTPIVNPTSTYCSAVTPAPPAALPGGRSVQLSWACTPGNAGTLGLGATVAGADDNTGAPLTATAATVSVPVQLPAALVAIPSATPATVVVGHAVTVSLRVYNGNGAAADLTAVTPVVDASSTAAATCGAVTPAPSSIPTLGDATFSWTCLPSTVGTLALTATVAGTDHNSGAAIGATPAPISVTVQAPPPSFTGTLGASATSITMGGTVTLTLDVSNGAGAGPGQVTAVTPSATAGLVNCSAVSGATFPASLGAGQSARFQWTCTGASVGSGTLGATVAVGSGTAPTVNTVGLTVTALPPSFTGVLGASATSIQVNGSVTVTLDVTNGASAGPGQVTAVTPSGTAGVVSCGAVTGTVTGTPFPVALAAGQTATFRWTCTGAGAGSATLGATVAVGSGTAPTVNTVGLTVTALPPSFTGTLTAGAASIQVGGTVNLTLIVSNGAGAGPGQVTAVTLSGTAGLVSCGAVTGPALPVTVEASHSATFQWTCTGAAAGSATLGATVGVGSGTAPTVNTVGLTVTRPVGTPLTGTVSVSPTNVHLSPADTATLSLTSLRNPGLVGVTLSAVTIALVAGSLAEFNCTGPTVGGAPVVVNGMTIAAGDTLASTLVWACTPTSGTPGTSVAFEARVTAIDTSGADASATLISNTITIALQ